MKPKKPSAQLCLGKVPLKTFINMQHRLVILADQINWEELQKRYEAMFDQEIGRPGLSIRLMVGLQFLKYTYNISDERMIAEFVRDPYFQYFCGMEYFEHEMPCDPTSMVRFRKKLTAEDYEMLLGLTLETASTFGLFKKNMGKTVAVDTTVQEKNITYPTDGKLIMRSFEKLWKVLENENIRPRQSYRRLAPKLVKKIGKLRHANRHKQADKVLRLLKTRLGRLIRDIERKADTLPETSIHVLSIAQKIQTQNKHDKGKVHSFHEPHVECISKGKKHKRFEFGVKVSLTTTSKDNWIVGCKTMFNNPYDGSTLMDATLQAENIANIDVKNILVDGGYRGKKYHLENKNVLCSKYKIPKSKKKLMKKRNAIEPIIGHVKHDHRMDRNFLKGRFGDEINPILASIGFNLKKILRGIALAHFWTRLLRLFIPQANPVNAFFAFI